MTYFPGRPDETFEQFLSRMVAELAMSDPRRKEAGQSARVAVEDRILESVKGGSIMTLRQVTDACNQFGDLDTFVLGQGAVNAALDRMERKGLVVRVKIEDGSDKPARSAFRFAL
jgi:uncharacterized protein YceH (UPF0502 family)